MNPTDHKHKTDPAHVSAAWGWIDRLRRDEVSQDELTDWFAWYNADPKHRAAFDNMQNMLRSMDRVTEGPDALSPQFWLGELADPRQAAPDQNLEKRWGLQLRRHRRVWAAVAAALVGGASAFMLNLESMPGMSPSAVYSAAAAGSEAVLADGSHVELAARSSVAVEMNKHQRTVTLQDGVAYFKVAKDASKPFVVNVGGFHVRAVGTAFNVRRAGERMVVTVAEGTVDVYTQGKGAQDAVRAHAGTEIAWMAHASYPAISGGIL